MRSPVECTVSAQEAENTSVFGTDELSPIPLLSRIPMGVLVEISGRGGTARTTTAVSLLAQAQARNESTVWIQPENGPLFPPDIAEGGIDLDSLLVVHVPDTGPKPHQLARAAELLLRSGAFGLVVIDFTEVRPRGDRWSSRLAALARRHDCQVLFLTEAEPHMSSVGAMVSIRLAPHRHRRGLGRFIIEPSILRDKTGRLGSSFRTSGSSFRSNELREQWVRGPWGLA